MTSSSTPTIVEEIVPLFFVEEIDRSVAFYKQLGFELAREWSPDGKLTWCRLQRGGAAVMLQQACEEDGPVAGRGRGVIFYFNCADVDTIHREFIASGLQLPAPKIAFYGEKQIHFHDPDGYELCFQSTVKQA